MSDQPRAASAEPKLPTKLREKRLKRTARKSTAAFDRPKRPRLSPVTSRRDTSDDSSTSGSRDPWVFEKGTDTDDDWPIEETEPPKPATLVAAIRDSMVSYNYYSQLAHLEIIAMQDQLKVLEERLKEGDVACAQASAREKESESGSESESAKI